MQILTTEERVLLEKVPPSYVPTDLEINNNSANSSQLFKFKPILTAEEEFLLNQISTHK